MFDGFLGLIVVVGGSVACWQAYGATSRFGYRGRAIAVSLTASIAITFGLAAYFHTGLIADTIFMIALLLIGVMSVLAIANRDKMNL